MTQNASTPITWWESLLWRSALGLLLVPAWFVLVTLFVATSHLRYQDTSVFDIYRWCIVGAVAFGLFAWLALAQTRAGKPVLPGWSLTLLSVICVAFLLLMFALSDTGSKASIVNGPVQDFYYPHLYTWVGNLQVPVTLGIAIGTGLYRLLPKVKWLWATLTFLVATVPFVVFAVFLLDYKNLI